MQVELSPADEQYIKEAVRNGYFANEKEAVTTAVRLMRKESEVKKQRLLDALAEGDADIIAGKVFDYTPEFLDEVMQEARNLVKSGNKIVYDTDLTP